MTDQADPKPYVERVHDDTLRYVRQLLDDNERLRSGLLQLQASNIELNDEVNTLRRELDQRQRTQSVLQEQISQLEGESRKLSEQYASIESQNSNLANLYVASYQLHGTVDRSMVLQIIQEIVANLVGSEEMAVYQLSPTGTDLEVIAANGIDPDVHGRIRFGEGTVGRAVADGSIYVTEDGRPGPDRVTASIPLQVEGRTIGAIVVYGLLPQKPALQPVDREMFELLSIHASTALYCATLHEYSAARVA